jgi:hypothetical protein
MLRSQTNFYGIPYLLVTRDASGTLSRIVVEVLRFAIAKGVRPSAAHVRRGDGPEARCPLVWLTPGRGVEEDRGEECRTTSGRTGERTWETTGWPGATEGWLPRSLDKRRSRTVRGQGHSG